jgi:hypothetical protein
MPDDPTEDPNVLGMARQLLDQRLNQAREAHELEKVPDLLKSLADNPEFLKALQKGLKPEQKRQLEKLGQDLLRGKSPQENPAWGELLKGLRAQDGDLEGLLKKQLGNGDADLLKRWAEKQPDLPNLPDGAGTGPSVTSPGSVGQPEGSTHEPGPRSFGPPPPVQPADPSLWERLEQKSNSWFQVHADEWAQGMNEWADSPLGNAVRNALRRAGQQGPPNGGFDFSDKTRGLVDKLGKVGQYLPTDRLRSLDLAGRLRNLHLPSLPSGGMHAVSLPSAPRASGAGVLQGLLWALVLLTLAAVLWRSLRWYREQAANADGWKLGPWPVRPEAVATREQLVSAFEYLALLCLGPVALACNHLDLASRLGAREGTDVEKRRAVEHLARLYERARYAPANEALPPEALTAARRDLCLLAGVAGA